MIRQLFGEIHTGQMSRLPFVGFSILLSVLLAIIFIAMGAAIGIAEHIIGGDIQQAQKILEEWLNIAFIASMVIFLVGYVFASCNLIAKRIRDIGLSGWFGSLLLIFAEILLFIFTSAEINLLCHSIIFSCLMLIPSRVFINN